MNKIFLFIFTTATLLFLSVTSVFASCNTTSLRICVEGGPYPTNSDIVGVILVPDVFIFDPMFINLLDINKNANICKTGYFHIPPSFIGRNRATFGIFDTTKINSILNNVEIDPSCNTNQIKTTRINAQELQFKVHKVPNEHQDWGLEYHLKVPTSTEEKAKLSCKIF